MQFLRRGIALFLADGVLAPFVAGAEPAEGSSAPEKVLLLGAAPFLKRSLMDQHFQPIAAHLSRSTGKRVELAVARSYSAFEEASKQGVYDLMISPSVTAVGNEAILIATISGTWDTASVKALDPGQCDDSPQSGEGGGPPLGADRGR